jgi:hypothetical protein
MADLKVFDLKLVKCFLMPQPSQLLGDVDPDPEPEIRSAQTQKDYSESRTVYYLLAINYRVPVLLFINCNI